MEKKNASLLSRIGMAHPIIQAPMAGVSTPAMAAAVSAAGALGSIGIGAVDAAGARAMIAAIRARTGAPFNVNLFCHAPAVADPEREAAWVERLRPQFAALGAAPPPALREIYRSFRADPEMAAMLVAAAPRVVSFHFGLPDRAVIAAMKRAGIVLLSSATNLAEAEAAVAAGVDAIVAQGWEAGGHRGVFDPAAPDDRLPALALTALLADRLPVPVIAAGGIMDGADIAAALAAGAAAAQLGTAFVLATESSADAGYRDAMRDAANRPTVMTRAISGRSARCLANRFTALGDGVPASAVPAYPIAYDAGKALHAAGVAQGEFGYGAQWAGTGAAGARALDSAALVATLVAELAIAQGAGRP